MAPQRIQVTRVLQLSIGSWWRWGFSCTWRQLDLLTTAAALPRWNQSTVEALCWRANLWKGQLGQQNWLPQHRQACGRPQVWRKLHKKICKLEILNCQLMQSFVVIQNAQASWLMFGSWHCLSVGFGFISIETCIRACHNVWCHRSHLAKNHIGHKQTSKSQDL